MTQKQSPAEIVKNYEEKGDEIIARMYKILEKAQRKVEDKEYRKVLERLDKEDK
jgi:hypothetical protein